MGTGITGKKAGRVYQLLLRCGAQRTLFEFCSQLVMEISGLVPYDQAREDLQFPAVRCQQAAMERLYVLL